MGFVIQHGQRQIDELLHNPRPQSARTASPLPRAPPAVSVVGEAGDVVDPLA
jgi:hypothetical protein